MMPRPLNPDPEQGNYTTSRSNEPQILQSEDPSSRDCAQSDLLRTTYTRWREQNVVRAEGVEPSRAFLALRIFVPTTAFAARVPRFLILPRPVCGLDYPFTLSRTNPGLRCRPSSLYTFPADLSPGLARDCHIS